MLRVTTESHERSYLAAVEAYQARRFAQAETLCRQILAQAPGDARAHYLLGLIALDCGQFPVAIELFNCALAADPIDPQAHNGLGAALAAAGRTNEALAAYRRAVQIAPGYLTARDNLGVLLQNMGRFDEAIAVYQETLRRYPDGRAALNNLGVILQRLGRSEEAVDAYRKYLGFYPNEAATHSNLGGALHDCGQTQEALAAIRRAIELDPDLTVAWSALLITLQYHPDYDARAIFAESARFNETHVRRLVMPQQSHANDPSPDRRLRIGYVSPDLCDHAIGRFMTPLLQTHNPETFEICCYSTRTPADDHTSSVLRTYSHMWRDVAGLSDATLADTIAADRVDLLVDLTMHANGGRPLLFARKPAPVQLAYLAYCGTTGLTAIDYRLSDPYLDPPGMDESCYSEKAIRLPKTYWCYQGPVGAPDPIDPPSLRSGIITFGCFNNYCKVTPPTVETWAQLLAGVESSRFILFCPPGAHRRHILDTFQRHGVAPQRIEFITRGSFVQYFQHYQRIDIALDPFPYGGGTTTCDALWMGVPVVSLRGNKPVARAGVSILSNAGLPELVAESPQHYIQIAEQLAADAGRLQALRRGLRQQLNSSPLMDALAFTRAIEQAYRVMWHEWCRGRSAAR